MQIKRRVGRGLKEVILHAANGEMARWVHTIAAQIGVESGVVDRLEDSVGNAFIIKTVTAPSSVEITRQAARVIIEAVATTNVAG